MGPPGEWPTLPLLPGGREIDSNHLGTKSGWPGTEGLFREVQGMRKHYDFSIGQPNPYAKRLKRQVTIRLDEQTLVYFKSLAEETAIPYQTLINLYLRECAASQKHLRLAWLNGAKADKPGEESPQIRS
jgi:hypothetical protein